MVSRIIRTETRDSTKGVPVAYYDMGTGQEVPLVGYKGVLQVLPLANLKLGIDTSQTAHIRPFPAITAPAATAPERPVQIYEEFDFGTRRREMEIRGGNLVEKITLG